MNYPIWEIPGIGGGSLIALIAVVHVYVSHLAVGGGLFLWLTDLKGFKENNPSIHDYVYKHTWFFLLLTMVFGGLTGVGIWFIIALVHPAATSSLIHNFVFGWAIEWVFFVGEIVALLVYAYKFKELNQENRLRLAFLYFLFAWLSLFIINGIITFMLTPGKWLETQNFWHGFFNPTYFPSLFFRSFCAFMFAGLFAYVTIVFLRDSDFRSRMMRYATRWLLWPLIGLVVSGLWYYFALPENLRVLVFKVNPQPVAALHLLMASTILIFVFGILLSLRSGILLQRILTFVLVLIGLSWMAGFEYTRETARKPYVIHDYMYSSGILKSDMEPINRDGVLTRAKWTQIKKITTENEIAAGRELFNIHCLGCHTVGGLRNDILPQIKNMTYIGLTAHLSGQGKIFNYMPPFSGTQKEKEALAAFITKELNKKEIVKKIAPYVIHELENEVPPFDIKTSEYVLLAWNDLGMHCLSDNDGWLTILPPANTLEAQLIKRGPLPELVTEGVEISYKVEKGFENPAAHVDFWKYSEKVFGVKLEENIGLAGKGLSGNFDFDENTGSFKAALIPVTPYNDDGTYNPYPLFEITAKDRQSGKVLAKTLAVAPNSSEMGCRNCHGGRWRVGNQGGIADKTAENILKAHDKHEKTNLLAQVQNGQPVLCQSCHADNVIGAKGKPGVLSLSSAMHGFHANYTPVAGAEICAMCHPAYSKGRTRCSRGVHGAVGLTCVNCHGEIQDHALALLKSEMEKPSAKRLMTNLEPVQVASKEKVNAREAWLQEPDCLTCHQDFEKPLPGAVAFNVWNEDPAELYCMRTDNAGIRCEACHGSTHALYPALNAFGKNRDNIQPIQYSGQPLPIGANFSCNVCHIQDMEDPIHHENMYRKFRNVDAIPQ
ncbi:MAG: cytochrome c family protein [Calditrichia bacterium]